MSGAAKEREQNTPREGRGRTAERPHGTRARATSCRWRADKRRPLPATDASSVQPKEATPPPPRPSARAIAARPAEPLLSPPAAPPLGAGGTLQLPRRPASPLPLHSSPPPPPRRRPHTASDSSHAAIRSSLRTLSKRTWLFTFSFSLPLDHFCVAARGGGGRGGAATVSVPFAGGWGRTRSAAEPARWLAPSARRLVSRSSPRAKRIQAGAVCDPARRLGAARQPRERRAAPAAWAARVARRAGGAQPGPSTRLALALAGVGGREGLGLLGLLLLRRLRDEGGEGRGGEAVGAPPTASSRSVAVAQQPTSAAFQLQRCATHHGCESRAHKRVSAALAGRFGPPRRATAARRSFFLARARVDSARGACPGRGVEAAPAPRPVPFPSLPLRSLEPLVRDAQSRRAGVAARRRRRRRPAAAPGGRGAMLLARPHAPAPLPPSAPPPPLRGVRARESTCALSAPSQAEKETLQAPWRPPRSPRSLGTTSTPSSRLS